MEEFNFPEMLAEEFNEDGDVEETLKLFARGDISSQSLVERLEYLRHQATRRVEQALRDAIEDAEADRGDSECDLSREGSMGV